MTAYYFGSFQINANSGGAGYFLEAKNLDTPQVTPILFQIARSGLMKKSGETTSPREIPLNIKVVGSSRLDLLTKLDALQKALFLRSQTLIIHDSGTRYYQSVDCVSATAAFSKTIVACLVQCKFLTADPYAYSSTASSHDTGTVALTLASSLWNFSAINISGGGTYYTYPHFHIVNKTSTGSTTLSAGLTSGNSYTSISVNTTGFSGAVGDKITITHGGTTQTLNVTSSFTTSATSISVTSFVAGANYASGDAVAKVTQWTAITITQTQDSQTITANTSTMVPLPKLNNEYVDIQCNPTVVGGMSVQSNGSGQNHDFPGVPPILGVDTTTFNISIACSSAVSAQCVISWKSRYLS